MRVHDTHADRVARLHVAVSTLLERVDDEAGNAVIDDLGGGAAGERDDGGADEHRLDHDETERLLPLNGKDQTARALEERDLRIVRCGSDPARLVAESSDDLALKVVVVAGVYLACEHDREPGVSSGVNREMGSLRAGEASEEDATVATLSEWVPLSSQTMVNDGGKRNFGRQLRLTSRDGDEVDVVVRQVMPEHRIISLVMDRRYRRMGEERRERKRTRVMDMHNVDVRLGDPTPSSAGMPKLRPGIGRPDTAVEQRCLSARARRIARSEDDRLVPELAKLTRELRDDELRSAVSFWRCR